MGLESTMICLDTSDWMRNGDYSPNRLMVQNDAANLICSAKTQSNPESTVGLLAMGGKAQVKMLVSPTDNYGKILNALHDSTRSTNDALFGSIPLSHAIQVAMLALKHRCEKKGAQRIILFVASPVAEEIKPLSKMGKVLKKNNIAVDVVSFGDPEQLNSEKLQAFVEAANSNDNSHFLIVPVGIPLTDVLVSSPIVHGGEGGGGGANGMMGGAEGGAGGFGFGSGGGGGVDPSMDPELALALRVSMEEERARQEAANKAKDDASTSDMTTTTSVEPKEDEEEDTESELLARAMALSQEETTVDNVVAQPPPAAPASAASSNSAFLDPNFVNNLLTGLPGVDPNDPKIKEAMEKINQSSKKDDKKDEKK